MANKIIYPTNKNIYVLSSIGPSMHSFGNFADKHTHDIIIVNGGISVGSDLEISERIDKFKNITLNNKIYYNKCDKDFIHLAKLRKNLIFNETYSWLFVATNVTIIEFSNQTNVIIVPGGIPEKYSNINNEIEFSFISTDWHDKYDGRLGLAISNNPKIDASPRNYKYSCAIGQKSEDKVMVQEISGRGLENFFELK